LQGQKFTTEKKKELDLTEKKLSKKNNNKKNKN
jgi:hypothetical protein